MNIQLSNKNISRFSKPSNFLEATVSLATCFEKALAAGVEGDDETTRYWVDASRPLKSFFKRYGDSENRINLVSGLEKAGGRQIMLDSLTMLKKAEPFVTSWATRFSLLQVRDFDKFQNYHWEIFIDEAVPLTWDWNSDLFVIIHSATEIVETLIKRGQTRIIILEPNNIKFRKLVKHISSLENSENVFVEKSKAEISQRISQWIDHPPHLTRVIGTTILEPEEEEKDQIKEIQDIVSEGMMNAVTFDATIKAHDQTWIENGFGNFESLVGYPNVKCLYNQFSDFSAIIVSPGPSLEKNVRLLDDVKGKAIIIAASHSLEFLKSRNIIPDVVVHVDPNVNIKKYFEDFEFEAVELLILSATTAPDLFELPARNKAWLYANAYFDNWLMELIEVEDYTLWGSCVSVAALKLAYMWGCKNVALIGQDLSFKAGDYYAGTTYAPQNVIDTFRDSVQTATLMLPGYYGGEVLTKNDYRIYHNQFEKLAKDLKERSKIKLFNCTEGGANIEGFKNCSLEDFISNVLNKNLNKNNYNFASDLKKLLSGTADKVKVRNTIMKTKRHLTKSENLLIAALKEIDVAEKVSFDSVKFKALHSKVAKKLKGSLILKMALQGALNDIFSDEGYEHSERGNLKKAIEMYKACLKVIRVLKQKLSTLNIR